VTAAMVEGLVSTIIPVYNRAAMLREAVASVLAQTHRPIEILIVDDGSTDDTARVADELAQMHPQEIRVIHQGNTGAGLAREAGRQAARGEFIQYLDSDDLLLPQKFAKQVAGLRANPERGVSYGKTRFRKLGDTSAAAAWKRTGEEIASMFPLFLESRWWGTSTPLYRSQLTDLAGPWTGLRNDEDWEYDCRIASHDVRLHYVSDFVSEERDHDGDRLSADGSRDRLKLMHRAKAHALMLIHAQRAGIAPTATAMTHFARELFLLSRQCGAAGLVEESKELFRLAREASGEARGKGWDFKLYGFLAGLIGWTRLGRVACYSDTIRNER
jgi:glycosyltransferase involved in cell wall biosynthesis